VREIPLLGTGKVDYAAARALAEQSVAARAPASEVASS
jgi:hypothetical protein